MCAYAYARKKEKRDGSNGNEGIFRHIFSLQKNARTFDIKRKCVLDGTQGRFFTNKNKRKYYTEMGIKKGVPLNSNLC